jgi:hypothetical protein
MPGPQTVDRRIPWRAARRTALALLLSLLGAIALAPAAASASVNFEVKGQWLCNNHGTVSALAGARVELWKSNTLWFDDNLGATHTSATGSYSFGVRADDNFDVYAKVVMNDDQGVHLGEWYSPSDWDTETATTASHAGLVNLGTYEISKDNGAGTPKCAVFQGAHNAYQNYKQAIGSAPPDSSYLINADFPCCGVPFTTLDRTQWPGGYETGYRGDTDGGYSVNFHEFAHSVRHSFDGSFLHFLSDAASYGYAKNHELCLVSNEGFAFNEGWAEFWAHTPATCGAGTNFNQEGNVAAALTALEKCASRATMVRVLSESPGSIHSYEQFKAKFFALVGQRACLISSIGGLQAVEGTIAASTLLAGSEAQIAALEKSIATMSRRTALVRSHAQTSGKCTKRNCLAGLQRVTEPSALSAEIAQAKLVEERLQSALAAARSAINGPESAQLKLFETLDAERASFERANQAILIAGLQQAVKAVKAKPGLAAARSSSGYRTIGRRLASMVAARKRGAVTPAGLATLFSTPQIPTDSSRRVTG